jgi:hypothetical protein
MGNDKKTDPLEDINYLYNFRDQLYCSWLFYEFSKIENPVKNRKTVITEGSDTHLEF